MIMVTSRWVLSITTPTNSQGITLRYQPISNKLSNQRVVTPPCRMVLSKQKSLPRKIYHYTFKRIEWAAITYSKEAIKVLRYPLIRVLIRANTLDQDPKEKRKSLQMIPSRTYNKWISKRRKTKKNIKVNIWTKNIRNYSNRLTPYLSRGRSSSRNREKYFGKMYVW